MNAYELADEAKRQSQLIYLATEERVAEQLSTMFNNYANMLRQQADRIAELEKEADRLSSHADELRKVHANKIAELEKYAVTEWIEESNEDVVNSFYKTFPDQKPQTKPLSDEEIDADEIAEMMADMYNQMSLKWKNSRGYSEQCDIMKAILRAIEAKVRGEK